MTLRTINDVIRALPKPEFDPLPTPRYQPQPLITGACGIALAVESMKDHTTNEGWQIMQALESQGYGLAGYNLPIGTTNISDIICSHHPQVAVLQDKREWDLVRKDFREPRARFINVNCLAEHPEIFRLTILKDAHQRPGYHRESALEIGCHAWITYYHHAIVQHVAPYVRSEHLVRTYHSLDSDAVPAFSANRQGSILSGAISSHYPFRQSLVANRHSLGLTYLKHPGYHRRGSATLQYLKTLSKFKVSLCTTSMYGYALRKIMESVACGCIVVTDLPVDEVLPGIDQYLVRVPPALPIPEMQKLLQTLRQSYDPERQQCVADIAQKTYDYRVLGNRLAQDIELLRSTYADG